MGITRRNGIVIYELPHESFKKSFQKGLWAIRHNLKTAFVSQGDPPSSKLKILDPKSKFLQFWNRLFLLSCILAISCDPFFIYLPFIFDKQNCLGFEKVPAKAVTAVRSAIDSFYLIRIIFQFRTAFVPPSSKVFRRGEVVTSPKLIAKRYIKRGYFFVDVLSILPLPQFTVWRYLRVEKNVYTTKKVLLGIILIQYIPRVVRVFPLANELKRTVGALVESAVLGAIYYMLLYMLSGHIVGSFWYLLALQRNIYCWEKACEGSPDLCKTKYLYCGNHLADPNFNAESWKNISDSILKTTCSVKNNKDKSSPDIVNFGIYTQALEAGVFSEFGFGRKFVYCLWWGLQNLSTLGQGLQSSLSDGEVCFSISIGVSGLLLFALLIGNMQTYLQSVTIRLDEMRLKRRDAEQWMHHRALPEDLRERVRRYDEYRWMETRGVDEQSVVESLPKDLRRDIKRTLCLNLVKRVPLFEKMDEQLLDAICERLKPSLCTDKTYVVREGDPVNEMLFIIRGRLESVTTDGGRSGFYNQSLLKEGDFCGDELLTWALDPKTGSHLPLSTRTVQSLSEVEAFALTAGELKFVASQFRRLHTRQVQHTFRYYSMQWRTWAAGFIQTAWHRHTRRKMLELLSMKERSSSAFGATIYASRFASNALRRIRSTRSVEELIKLQKPPEPDFSADITD